MLFRRRWTHLRNESDFNAVQVALNTFAKWVWFQCCSGGIEHVRQKIWFQCCFRRRWTRSPNESDFNVVSGGVEHVRQMSLISMLFQAALNTFAKWVWFQCWFWRRWTRSPNESDFNAVSGGVEHVRAAVGVGAEPEPESVAAWPAAEPLLCWRPRGWCPLRPGESGPLYCRLLSDVVYCT